MRSVLIILIAVALFNSAHSIKCYVCNTTDSSNPFQCGEWFERFDTPDIEPQECSSVHNAQFCVKHIGRFGGGIGAKRFCSSKDLGNYCDYVQNRGDQLEYRSCIYTCGSDGCNSTSKMSTSISFILTLLFFMTIFQKIVL